MSVKKKWNWQQRDWPNFSYDKVRIKAQEDDFLYRSGHLFGATMHIRPDEQQALLIERMSDEALKTSEIEGEILNRESVQSSIRRRLGLVCRPMQSFTDEMHSTAVQHGTKSTLANKNECSVYLAQRESVARDTTLATHRHAVGAAEAGIAEMMVDLYQHYDQPLSHDMLYGWQAMIMNGRRDIDFMGGYRQHEEPMQVISGRLDVPTVHFEAPPSKQVHAEMEGFVIWFNNSVSLPALTRASIAHLYFESIHPFEDGNGRIGRCLVEKSLAQSLGRPITTGLSHVIHAGRKQYYAMLEQSNKTNQIDAWLEYFSEMILSAQTFSITLVEFIIRKTHFYDRFHDTLNARQQKVLARMFREGIDGFKGGLSAENYIAITGTSRATATRDLSDLVAQGAFTKTGAGKGTRYTLTLE